MMNRKIFGKYKYAKQFCRELTNEKIYWQMTIQYDQPHFEDDDKENMNIYNDYIVDYWMKEEEI